MVKNRIFILTASVIVAFFMIVPTIATAGVIGVGGGGGSGGGTGGSGGGGGTNTYYSISGSASVSPTTVTEYQNVQLTLSVSSYSNDPSAVFQITSSNGNSNVYSVTISSDGTYTHAWQTDNWGTFGFRIAYISEEASSGAIYWSYINGNSFTVSPTSPSISSVSVLPNPGIASLPVNFTAQYSFGSYGSGSTTWSVGNAAGNWTSSAHNSYIFRNPGTYSVTFTVSTGYNGPTSTTSKTVQETVDSPSSPAVIYFEITKNSGYINTSLASITFDHMKFYSGQSYTVADYHSYTLDGSLPSPFMFQGWVSDYGNQVSFAERNQPSTTVYVNGGGKLGMLITLENNTWSPQAGYVQYSNSPNMMSMSAVMDVPMARYNLPSNVSAPFGGIPPVEAYAMIAGLGGTGTLTGTPLNSSTVLDNTYVGGGFFAFYNSSGSFFIRPIITYGTPVEAGTGSSDSFIFGGILSVGGYFVPSIAIQPGDVIYLTVTTSTVGSTITIQDNTTGQRNTTTVPFIPNGHSTSYFVTPLPFESITSPGLGYGVFPASYFTSDNIDKAETPLILPEFTSVPTFKDVGANTNYGSLGDTLPFGFYYLSPMFYNSSLNATGNLTYFYQVMRPDTPTYYGSNFGTNMANTWNWRDALKLQ